MTSSKLTIAPAPIDPVPAARAAVLALRDHLRRRFIERDTEAQVLMLALVAREHVCMIGTPGEAKSALTDAMIEALGARSFRHLMTRFTEPGETEGPLDMAALQAGRQRRVTSGMLPDAEIAFLDEGFKGSSASLNTTLTMLNERRHKNDGAWSGIPLRTLVVASNEMPEPEDGLGAFEDRLLLRLCVGRLSPAGIRALLARSNAPFVEPVPSVTLAQLDALAAAADAMPVSDEALEAVAKVRDALLEKGVEVSSRRIVKAVGVLRAAAVLDGAAQVTSVHLAVLEHICWRRPEEIPVVREVVRQHVANWLKAVRDSEAALDDVETRIATASRKGGSKHDGIAALARCLDALTEIVEVIDVLPAEAAGESVRVRDRIKAAKASINSAMRTFGIGV